MTKNDALSLSKKAKGFYPSLTVEQVGLVTEILAPYRYERALSILKLHRATHEYFEFPQFNEGLRADHEKNCAKRNEFANERMVDAIKRMARTQWGIAEYEGMSDLAVITKHYKSLAKMIKSDQQVMRLWIFQKSRQAFEEIGIGHMDALTLAGECAGTDNARKLVDENTKEELHGNKFPALLGLLAT